MRKADLYLKIVLELDESEKAERLAREICRAVEKIYGVRSAEVSNLHERE
jgi:hypothetical protein